MSVSGVDCDYSEEDEKERRQLIEQVFELQNTLDGLHSAYLLTYLLAFSLYNVNMMKQ